MKFLVITTWFLDDGSFEKSSKTVKAESPKAALQTIEFALPSGFYAGNFKSAEISITVQQ